ncbi:MAG: heme-binding protein, partial [Planctomycetota bacterium]
RGLKEAASHVPRVDAIGGSTAGVVVGNQIRVSSLFRSIPPERYAEARSLFHRLRDEWKVPVEVANDGDVTALAGAMSLEAKAILGVAMGSSEAAGYFDRRGQLTGRLTELAFAPVDFNPSAARDEWSGDIGVGAMYFSQQAVNRLAAAAGITYGLFQVQIQPAARAAGADFDGNRDKTFSALFAHLQTRKLEMASPVMQTYTSGPEEQSLGSLCRIAFFYKKPNMGAVGNDGTVLVADVPAVTVVSVAVQGEYTSDRFAPALKVLRSWLADHTDRYAAAGEPRVLAYNSPLVPGFMRYAEVQIPIRTK